MRHNRVLVIDDQPDLLRLIKRLLELEGFAASAAANGSEALKILKTETFDIVITDVRLPDADGITLIPQIKSILPSAEIIIITAYGKIEDGVKAVKAGAFDYLVKGDEDNKLMLVVKNAHEKIKLAHKLEYFESSLITRYSFQSITGTSPAIAEAVRIAQKAAPSDSPILITGETGTGKEVFARSIHYSSPRAREPFVAINCSAFAAELLESEMFGYKAGAFTGAVKNKKGIFEEADKGTLFLDEIGDMPLPLQSKLLRVLENNTFIKQGDTKETMVDVRIIAAANKDLKELTAKGQFRSDLYFRISVILLNLPPLRSRPEDIPLLTEEFITRFCHKFNKPLKSLHPSFLTRLSGYSFPGNIRELKNLLERIILLNDNPVLNEYDLPPEFLELNQQPQSAALAQVEKQHILSVLNANGGNKVKTASALQIGLTTLYRKLNEYGIDENETLKE